MFILYLFLTFNGMEGTEKFPSDHNKDILKNDDKIYTYEYGCLKFQGRSIASFKDVLHQPKERQNKAMHKCLVDIKNGLLKGVENALKEIINKENVLEHLQKKHNSNTETKNIYNATLRRLSSLKTNIYAFRKEINSFFETSKNLVKKGIKENCEEIDKNLNTLVDKCNTLIIDCYFDLYDDVKAIKADEMKVDEPDTKDEDDQIIIKKISNNLTQLAKRVHNICLANKNLELKTLLKNMQELEEIEIEMNNNKYSILKEKVNYCDAANPCIKHVENLKIKEQIIVLKSDYKKLKGEISYKLKTYNNFINKNIYQIISLKDKLIKRINIFEAFILS